MIRNIEETILHSGWKILKSISFEYENKRGNWKKDKKEVYVRGDAATILLYNLERKSVLLTKQFRMPTYMNGNNDGHLIETCAGMLDGRSPEDCIIKETEEETGLKICNVTQIFNGYTSPGAITEMMYFFIGEYNDEMRVGEGGGLEEENEKIEILEMPFDELFQKIYLGEIIDTKTIVLALHLKLNVFI